MQYSHAIAVCALAFALGGAGALQSAAAFLVVFSVAMGLGSVLFIAVCALIDAWGRPRPPRQKPVNRAAQIERERLERIRADNAERGVG